MKSLIPLLFLFTYLSCNNDDTSKNKENISKSPTVAQDSVDKVIENQQKLQKKIFEIAENKTDTSKQYIFFTYTVMDKSNQYIDLLSRIYTINKKDKSKIESIKSCISNIIKKNYYLNSDVIPVLREFATLKEANENRALYSFAQEIIHDKNCE